MEMLHDLKTQLRQMNSQERPDIMKMIKIEQQRLQFGQLERKKTDIRDHINSDNIIKHVHFLNLKQHKLKMKEINAKQVSPSMAAHNI